MRRLRLLFAICVLWPVAVSAGVQGESPEALPEAVRAHVTDGRFGIVTSIRGLPLGVRDALQVLFGSRSLDIAEPDADFRATEGGNPTLPPRRLIAAGCSAMYCLVYYELGGVTRTFRVALFRWTPDATRFEWGATAPSGLATIGDVRNAVLAGSTGVAPTRW